VDYSIERGLSHSRSNTPLVIRSQHPVTNRDLTLQNDLGIAVSVPLSLLTVLVASRMTCWRRNYSVVHHGPLFVPIVHWSLLAGWPAAVSAWSGQAAAAQQSRHGEVRARLCRVGLAEFANVKRPAVACALYAVLAPYERGHTEFASTAHRNPSI
jgi:hypothetical protein